jgi:thiosulfate reductase cytochrome b subunit
MSDILASAARFLPRRKRGKVGEVIYRHRLVTRVTHWINVVCFCVLLLSGLQILNAHPALYWGQYGADDDQPFIAFTGVGDANGELVGGQTKIGPILLNTTGLLGASTGPDGLLTVRGMPAWATLPSYQDLSTGRRWHFFFAWLFVINGLVYVIAGFVTRHFQRDLLPTRDEIKPRHLIQDIWDHARLKLPKGEAAKSYNVLQKLAYLAAILLLIAMVLTGLTMSPGVNAAAPFLLDLFGGRQSARTLHFLSANLLVAFIVVHVAMVFLAGPINEIGSMITGRYRVPPEADQ